MCGRATQHTMGIRGAWSLLSNDPRRFASPCLIQESCKDGKEKNVLVFVDGPSLLYHVSVSSVYDVWPPLTIAHIAQCQTAAGSSSSSSGQQQQQASPATIYTRVVNFIRALLQVVVGQEETGRGQVHVVMDGLAPFEKTLTQVQRLQIMAQQCDWHAANPKSRCKKPPLHLLAESSMLEALHDIQKEREQSLFVHQQPRGEAEAFIDCWIRRKHLSSESLEQQQQDEIFVLSDDTDFLVYSSCPGFIPFRTIEFHVLDGQYLTLTGLHYQRSKLVSAFLSSCFAQGDLKTNDDLDCVMTTVAALVGCDYTLLDSAVFAASTHDDGATVTTPSSNSSARLLTKARSTMVRSDIGGLRPRLRSNPTASAALTAVLRSVSHYCKKQQQQNGRKQDSSSSSWTHAMAEAVCSNSKEREQLLVALQAIHTVYFPLNEQGICCTADHHRSNMSVDCRRLLEYGILYCRPLAETWSSTNIVKAGSKSTFDRKRGRTKAGRRGKLRKRTFPPPAVALPLAVAYEMEVVDDNPPSRDAVVPIIPPTQAIVDVCLSATSAWSLFAQVRTSLYAFIYQHVPTQDAAATGDGTTNIQYHAIWRSPNPSVTEYVRVGSGEHVRFVSTPVVVPTRGYSSTAEESTATLDAFLQCVASKDQAKHLQQHPVKDQDWVVLLASLMLPAKASLLLLLLFKAPDISFEPLAENTELLSLSLQECLVLIPVAIFHAKLLCDVSNFVSSSTSNGETGIASSRDQGSAPLSRVFRHDAAAWIWASLILALDTDCGEHDEQKNQATLSRVLDSLFNQLMTPKVEEELPFREVELQTWYEGSKELWTTWCSMADLQQRKGRI